MRRRSKVIPSLAVASQVAGALVLVALSTGQGRVAATSTDVATEAELRAAITAMNGSDDGIDDTITLTSAGPYVLPCGSNENDNADGDLDYNSSDNLTITFAGPGRATIEVVSGCTNERVIHHRGTGTLTLERIRITGGDLTDATSNIEHGGGIMQIGAGGVLVLNDVSVDGNRASTGGAPGSNAGGRGGGITIWNGSATITDSVISNNRAGDGGGNSPSGSGGAGGGIYAYAGTSVTLVNTDVRSNQAGNGSDSSTGQGAFGGSGGGIAAVAANVDITGGSIGGPVPADGNTAGSSGASLATIAGQNGAGGGGIRTGGILTIDGTTIANNSAGTPAAGVNAKAGNGGAGGGISMSIEATITKAFIFDNKATAGADAVNGQGGTGGGGGRIDVSGTSAELTIINTEINNNESGDGGNGDTGAAAPAGNGGGIDFRGETLSITASVIDGNTTGDGGNYTGVIGGPGGGGAGVYAIGSIGAQKTFTIESSTISNNVTGVGGTSPGHTNHSGHGAPGFGGDGGGLNFASDEISTVDQTTISGNTASRHGGGIYSAGGLLSVNNSTIDSNTADSEGGGIYSNGLADIEFIASTVSSNVSPAPGANLRAVGGGGGPIDLIRTLIANPQGGGSNCDGTSGGGNSLEHQASGAFSCSAANTTTTLGLSSLADNGGPTSTRLPVVGSAAHDAITPGTCFGATDQRGVNRPKGTGCDIGAVEIDPSVSALDDNDSTMAVAVVIDVLSNDVGTDTELDADSVSATAGPSNGDVTFSASTGKATYTPDNGFTGIDEFTYQVCSAGQPTFCDTATVEITVTELPPPVIPPPVDDTPGVVTITPARLLETRAGNTTVDGQQQAIGRRNAQQVTTVNIAGRAAIPGDADAAIINIGAVNPANNGFITAYPCNQARPGSPTLNYTAGTTIANGATIKLSPAGTICIYTHQAMDLIIDVTAYTSNIP